MTISELNNLLNLLEKNIIFQKISSEASLSSPSLNENLKLEKYSLYLLNIGKIKYL
ncbi:hypothetical protein QUR95_00155 [Candidatus Nasuia deltocephalinicola]|nr:hypothetical protein QUR95_00155 [Candidatus Nasuia deltocephalinicola]